MSNRRVVYLAFTLLTAILIILDFLSDLLLRTNNSLQGASYASQSWDSASAIAVVIWLYLSYRVWHSSR